MIASSSHRIKNAYRFSQTLSWYVLGGTDAWVDENAPPVPDQQATTINTPIGAKVATVSLVYRDDVGGSLNMMVGGSVTKWSVASDLASALANNAMDVIVSCSFNGVEFPLTTYREIGLVSGLTTVLASDQSNPILLPPQVADFGSLELVEYVIPTNRDANTMYTLMTLVSF